VTLNNGGFDLKANRTYKLEAAVGGSSTGYAYYAWVDNANNLLAGGSVGVVMKAGNAYSDAPQDKAIVYYTPIANTTVFLRVYNLSGTLTAFAPSLSINYSSTWASIQQIGSSAIINPWVLSGNDVYNITGKVGIGTNTPSYNLDINGTAKLSTTPNITTATNVLVKDPSTSQISEQPISFVTGVAKFILNTTSTSVAAGSIIPLNTTRINTISNYVSLNTSTGLITLQPGTYELNGSAGGLNGTGGTGDVRVYSMFHNGSTYVGSGGVSESGPAGNWNGMPQNAANHILTVPQGQTAQIYFKVIMSSNVASLSGLGDFGDNGDAGRSWVIVRKYN
jgi:hypothetical protein